MPIINRVAALHEEIIGWRRDFHENPELGYEVQRTAGLVAERLRAFGCDEVVPGVGRTGVVGVIRGRLPGNGTIGLRADMDALPMQELTGLPYASKTKGRMHACGHDGHTSMLLGAAKYLAETRNFAGTAVVIFQPAEENGAGGKAMVDDGMMGRFGVTEVYGMHNMPGIPVGHFGLRAGPLMAASDQLTITIGGKGSHAATPHLSIDPVFIGCQFGTMAQAIVARTVDPLDSAVVSITQFQAGDAFNIIPHSAWMRGTVRSLKADTRLAMFARLQTIGAALAAQHGATVDVVLDEGYPVTVNHAEQAAFAAKVAADVVGPANVNANTVPVMGGEDFSFMLQARPGAFVFIGNGPSEGLHHPGYEFAEAAIPAGVSFLARLVEQRLPA